jgi:hypothetical protein
MRVKVSVASTAEAEDIKTAASELECKPLFFGTGRENTVFIMRTMKDDGTVLFASLVKVCGRTGKLTVVDRTKQVVPLAERSGSSTKRQAAVAAPTK